MDFKPQYCRTNPLSLIVRLEDRHGNVRFAVTFCNGVFENEHFLFAHLSSAIDFINSNLLDLDV